MRRLECLQYLIHQVRLDMKFPPLLLAMGLLSIGLTSNEDSFSPSWITSEAHRLLERVQSEMPSQAITSSRKVLFVAYGLGGVVVKKVSDSFSSKHTGPLTIENVN